MHTRCNRRSATVTTTAGVENTEVSPSQPVAFYKCENTPEAKGTGLITIYTAKDTFKFNSDTMPTVTSLTLACEREIGENSC